MQCLSLQWPVGMQHAADRRESELHHHYSEDRTGDIRRERSIMTAGILSPGRSDFRPALAVAGQCQWCQLGPSPQHSLATGYEPGQGKGQII